MSGQVRTIKLEEQVQRDPPRTVHESSWFSLRVTERSVPASWRQSDGAEGTALKPDYIQVLALHLPAVCLGQANVSEH